MTIRVVIVEDERLTAKAHEKYVSRLEGFSVVRICHRADAALSWCTENPDGFDVILLDMNLPDGYGLDLCRALHARHITADIIAIAAREFDEVRISRQTARRYMEYLADQGLVERRTRHGGSGRPELEYRWIS